MKNYIDFNLSVNHNEKLIELKISYSGKKYEECLNEETMLSQKIIENIAQNLISTQNNNTNQITVKLNLE